MFKKPILQSTSITSLPDDLLLSCFARVSRLYYPTLSLVSKKFRLLLASTELYKVRSLLGRTENCLYVCLRFSPDSDSDVRWFTLCRIPETMKKKKKKNSSGNILISIPSPHPPQGRWTSVVAVGSSIYTMGGLMSSPSSSVSMLDCRTHRWHQAPNMQVARSNTSASVFDGKIYVAGGCKDCNSSNCMEVFDTKTQIWGPLSSYGAKICRCILRSEVIDEKVHIYGYYKGVVYNPKEDTCEPAQWNMRIWESYYYCVIDNVLYYYDEEGFKWYDTKVRVWRILKGLKGLPIFPNKSYVRFADYGGKMVVLWYEIVSPFIIREKRKIWCAVVVLERCNSEEISGKVEWFDVVLKCPRYCVPMHVLVATV